MRDSRQNESVLTPRGGRAADPFDSLLVGRDERRRTRTTHARVQHPMQRRIRGAQWGNCEKRKCRTVKTAVVKICSTGKCIRYRVRGAQGAIDESGVERAYLQHIRGHAEQVGRTAHAQIITSSGRGLWQQDGGFHDEERDGKIDHFRSLLGDVERRRSQIYFLLAYRSFHACNKRYEN